MSDIPKDIDEIASDIMNMRFNSDQDSEWETYKAISRAIMAERLRCSEIASKYASEAWGMTEEEHAATAIASAIMGEEK